VEAFENEFVNEYILKWVSKHNKQIGVVHIAMKQCLENSREFWKNLGYNGGEILLQKELNLI
jgi:hypothetical protein